MPAPALPIDRTYPFRATLDCGEDVWLAEHTRLGSPISEAQQRKSYNAVKPWSAYALSCAVKETEAGKTAHGQHNEFNLFVDGGGPKNFPDWETGAKEWYQRLSDPTYKASYPGVYLPRDLPLEGVVATFQGGPGCWSSKGQTCAHGETWTPCQSGSIELSIQQAVARINTYMGHPQTTPWSPVPNPPGCGGAPPATDDPIAIIVGGSYPPVTYGFLQDEGLPYYAYIVGHGGTRNTQHSGDDVGVSDLTELYSPAAGTVLCVGESGTNTWGQGCGFYHDDEGGIGNITILFDAGTKLTLGHCTSATVTPGQRVTAGQLVGRSGSANGDHVHIEMCEQRNGTYWLVDPVPALRAVLAAATPPAGDLVFGRVPKPAWTDRQIPDAQNWAWDNLGQRKVLGITYHRMVGTLWGTDSWFRGGGGGAGLTDFGIDHNTSETLLWNDYLGKGRAGISPNRAGWASGPWEQGSSKGVSFVNQFGVNAINRDRVSLEISGNYGDPISATAQQKIVALSAYIADQAKIPWDQYPMLNQTVWFPLQHGDFQSHKDCAGGVVRGLMPAWEASVRTTLRQYQEG